MRPLHMNATPVLSIVPNTYAIDPWCSRMSGPRPLHYTDPPSALSTPIEARLTHCRTNRTGPHLHLRSFLLPSPLEYTATEDSFLKTPYPTGTLHCRHRHLHKPGPLHRWTLSVGKARRGYTRIGGMAAAGWRIMSECALPVCTAQ